MRFPKAKAWTRQSSNFQFSLWDSIPSHGVMRGVPFAFQFSLWDSLTLKHGLKIILNYFQFSLWDSKAIILYITPLWFITFNSLYEIQILIFFGWPAKYLLSILFMRFKRRLKGLEKVSALSILFMRFQSYYPV